MPVSTVNASASGGPDAGVVALLRTGRREDARMLYTVLAPATGRARETSD